MKRLNVLRHFLFLGLFMFVGGHLVLATEADSGAYFQERANLALREVAHRMLMINGDSTSRVPAVRTHDGLQFIVRFPGELRYDTLRSILDRTFEAAGLPLRYDLAIYDCLDESLILGFTAQPQNRNESYACQEREPVAHCVNMAIRFPGQGNQITAGVGWLTGIGLLMGLAFLSWWRRKQNEPALIVQISSSDPQVTSLQIGNSFFQPEEQKIRIGQEEKILTYRESKLLQYFCSNQNKVLPREDILDAVWGEEGVQVTRSLDVFVSRLRKILKKDPSVQIASVHGVGYRLVSR